MEQLTTLKELILTGHVEQAVHSLNEWIDTPNVSEENKAEAYYLLGNAYRKQGNWQQALNHYQYASELSPEGPAPLARKAVIDILDFYHKDMFNQ